MLLLMQIVFLPIAWLIQPRDKTGGIRRYGGVIGEGILD